MMYCRQPQKSRDRFMHPPLLSAIIAATVGLGSKAFLKLCDVKVVGLSRFLEVLEEKRQGKGLLTGKTSDLQDPPLTGL